MTLCHHKRTSERPKYAPDDPPGHYLCLDCGSTFPLIGDTDQWEPVEKSTELVVVGLGEVVDLTDTKSCALALDAIRDLEWKLRNAKKDLTRAIVEHSQAAGKKTLHGEGFTVVIKGGSTTSYDAEEIYAGLLEAGMSQERAGEIVKETVTRKVSAVEAKQAAAANPAYAAVIARFTHVEESEPSVTVSRKG